MDKCLAMLGNPLASAVFLFSAFGVTQIPARAEEPAKTTLTDRPGEAIRQKIPLRTALPKTISIDAMSFDEIQEVRRDLYLKIDERIDDRCLAWVFKKQPEENSFIPVGFIANRDLGAIKVNGNLRPMNYSKAIHGINAASLSMYDFTEVHTYSDLLAHHQTRFENLGKAEPLGAMKLQLYFKDEIVETKDMACTLMRARCRRYTTELQSIQWETIMRKSKIENLKEDRLKIERKIPLTLAIEDMCPFRRKGIIEGVWRSRMAGEEPGVRKFGLPKNATLNQAIAPYVSDNLKSKK